MRLLSLLSANRRVAGNLGVTGRYLVFALSTLGVLSLIISMLGCSSFEPMPANETTTSPVVSPSNATLPSIPAEKMKDVPPQFFLVKIKPSLISDGLRLGVQATIHNPNPGKVEIDDLIVSTLSNSGSPCTRDTFPGGNIDPASNNTFIFNIDIPRKFLSDYNMALQIDAKTQNTDPFFSLKSITQLDITELLKKGIIYPLISVSGSIDKITYEIEKTELEALVEGKIDNTNPIDFDFSVMELKIRDKVGTLIQNVSLPGGLVPANSSYPFKRTMPLPVSSFDQGGLTISAYTTLQYVIYSQLISKTAPVTIPTSQSLIVVPEMTISVDDEWLSTDLYVVKITSTIKNTNVFPLTAEDYHIKIYDNTKSRVLDTNTMSSEIVQGVPANNVRNILFQFNFSKDDIGRGIDTTITGDIKLGLEGVKITMPISTTLDYKLTPRPH